MSTPVVCSEKESKQSRAYCDSTASSSGRGGRGYSLTIVYVLANCVPSLTKLCVSAVFPTVVSPTRETNGRSIKPETSRAVSVLWMLLRLSNLICTNLGLLCAIACATRTIDNIIYGCTHLRQYTWLSAPEALITTYLLTSVTMATRRATIRVGSLEYNNDHTMQHTCISLQGLQSCVTVLE